MITDNFFIIIRLKELSKVLNHEAKNTSQPPVAANNNTTNDDADREEYFGTSRDSYPPLSPGERYPPTGMNGRPQANENIYGTKTNHTGPEPPPRVDRSSKPSRF